MAEDAAEATSKLKAEASEMADKVSAKAKEVAAEIKRGSRGNDGGRQRNRW